MTDCFTIDIEPTYIRQQDRYKIHRNTSIEVIKNPTRSELIRLNKQVRDEMPGLMPDDVKIRSTVDAKGNEYIWKAHEAVHDQVVPELSKLDD